MLSGYRYILKKKKQALNGYIIRENHHGPQCGPRQKISLTNANKTVQVYLKKWPVYASDSYSILCHCQVILFIVNHQAKGPKIASMLSRSVSCRGLNQIKHPPPTVATIPLSALL